MLTLFMGPFEELESCRSPLVKFTSCLSILVIYTSFLGPLEELESCLSPLDKLISCLGPLEEFSSYFWL